MLRRWLKTIMYAFVVFDFILQIEFWTTMLPFEVLRIRLIPCHDWHARVCGLFVGFTITPSVQQHLPALLSTSSCMNVCLVGCLVRPFSRQR